MSPDPLVWAYTPCHNSLHSEDKSYVEPQLYTHPINSCTWLWSLSEFVLNCDVDWCHTSLTHLYMYSTCTRAYLTCFKFVLFPIGHHCLPNDMWNFKIELLIWYTIYGVEIVIVLLTSLIPCWDLYTWSMGPLDWQVCRDHGAIQVKNTGFQTMLNFY